MNFLCSLKVGSRLAVGFGVILASLLIVGVIGLSRMSLLQGNLDQIVKSDYAKVTLVNTMRDAVRYQAVALRDVVMQEDLSFKKKELKLMKEARKNYLSAAERLEKGMTLPEEMVFFSKLKPLEEEVQTLVREVVDLSLGDRTVESGNLTRDKLRPK